jgi:hypothetical protein
MPSRVRQNRGVTIAVLVIGIAGAGSLPAQERSAVRPDLSGTWTLDSYLSNNPEQVAREIRIDTGQSADQALFLSGTNRGRARGAGRGTGAGRSGSADSGHDQRKSEEPDRMSPEARKKVGDLTDRCGSVRVADTHDDTDR